MVIQTKTVSGHVFAIEWLIVHALVNKNDNFFSYYSCRSSEEIDIAENPISISFREIKKK